MVSRSLGHSNLSTTADVYAHVTPAMQARSAECMDRILAGGGWCGYGGGYGDGIDRPSDVLGGPIRVQGSGEPGRT